jgi:hypothetical protein
MRGSKLEKESQSISFQNFGEEMKERNFEVTEEGKFFASISKSFLSSA